MKLYDNSAAPNPRRVRIFLAEKGMSVPLVPINLMEREQLQPYYQDKNYYADIPLLELEDGKCISQVNAICRYFEELAPEPSLMGKSAEEKARIEMWNHIVEITGVSAVMEAFRNASPRFIDRALTGLHNYEQQPVLIQRGRQRILNCFKDFNIHLLSKEFVAGDQFSIADITLVVTIDFAKRIDIAIPPENKNLIRWYNQVSTRGSMTV